MPELPEVQTIVDVLSPYLKNKKIIFVRVFSPDVIARPDLYEFDSSITNQVFSSVTRRGKFIIFSFNSGKRLTLHLRMTGALTLNRPTDTIEPHTHVTFLLDNGEELRYNDWRRFGRFWLIDSSEEDTFSGIDSLGYEPFDESLNADYLIKAFGKSSRAIKTCLMNQKIIAGIGNIYSDEILFSSRILPERPSSSLTTDEWETLSKKIPVVMSFFVEKNRVSINDFRLSNGREYRNSKFFNVYGRNGCPCNKCGLPLDSCSISGRTSVFCRNCQK